MTAQADTGASPASGSWDVEIQSSYGNLPAVFHVTQTGNSIDYVGDYAKFVRTLNNAKS